MGFSMELLGKACPPDPGSMLGSPDTGCGEVPGQGPEAASCPATLSSQVLQWSWLQVRPSAGDLEAPQTGSPSSCGAWKAGSGA